MANTILKALISYIILLSIFITGSDLELSQGTPIYWYYPVYVCFIVISIFVHRTLSLKIIYVLGGIILYSLFFSSFNIALVLKQFTNITVFTLVAYYLIVHEDFNIEKLFKKYVQLSKVILVVGFFQVMLFSLHCDDIFLAVFPFLKHTNITFRFQSLTDEPSFIGLTFAPVVFASLDKLFNDSSSFVNKPWSILFITGYILTFSLTTYLGLIVMLAFIGLKSTTFLRGALLFVMVIFISISFGTLAYRNSALIKTRVNDTFYGLTHNFTEPETYKRVNVSTYAFLSNAYVASKSLKAKFWTGYGLGTHELAYDKFLPASMRQYSTLNRLDANSLTIRLITETGMIGLGLFCLFLVYFKIRSNLNTNVLSNTYWIINTGIAAFIFIAMLRNGNYTAHGKILFILMYYYSFVFAKKETELSTNHE